MPSTTLARVHLGWRGRAEPVLLEIGVDLQISLDRADQSQPKVWVLAVRKARPPRSAALLIGYLVGSCKNVLSRRKHGPCPGVVAGGPAERAWLRKDQPASCDSAARLLAESASSP